MEVQETIKSETTGEQKLPRILRQLGSVLLILAAVAFLSQRWDGFDHVARYLSFLGFTVAMALAGVFCGVGIKEGKGARTLLALFATIIPVHFAQLGALVFSRFGKVLNPEQYPTFLRWTAPSESSALTTLAIAFITITPLLYLAYSTLDRSVAKRLTIGALLANCLLLVPVRDPNFIALLSIGLLAAVAVNDCFVRQQARFGTYESSIARLTLYAVPVLMLGRQLTLYSCSDGLVAVTLLATAAAMALFIPRHTSRAFGAALELLSTAPLIVGWGFALSEFGFMAPHRDSLTLVMFGLVPSVLMFAFSRGFRESGPTIQFIAGGLAILTSVVQIEMHAGLIASLYSLSATIGVFMLAYLLQRRSLLVLSGISAVYTLLYHLRLIIENYDLSIWITLGATGVITIVAASYIEKHRGAIVETMKNARLSVDSWR